MLENLRKELIGMEMYFVELDNVMVANGYYSVLDDGVTEEIKEDKNVVYAGVESGECEIQIFFEITIDGEEDEAIDNFILKVTGVENF